MTKEDAKYREHAFEHEPKTEEVEAFINVLKDIYDKVWYYDIPSPTVPEYIEHHEQMQDILKYINMYIDKYESEVK